MEFELSDLNLDRTVYLFDQFYQDTAQELIQDLIELDSKATEDIFIVINSYGGSVYALTSIMDTIKNLKSNVNTVCLGIAASCGSILFALGNKRYIGENSKVMIHQVSSMAWGTVTEMEDAVNEAKDLNDKLFNVLLEKGTLTEAKMKEIFNRDSYLDAEKVMEYGFADAIITAPTEEDSNAVYVNEAVKQSINNFKGSTRDSMYATAMATTTKNRSQSPARTLRTKVENKISKKETEEKGAKSMDLAEIKAELTSKHGVDLDAMTNEISELKAAVADGESRIAQVTADHKTEKIDALLDGLITAGKSTQVLNEGYRVMFSNMEYDDAVKFSNSLPVMIKTSTKSTSDNDNEDQDVSDSADKEADKIQAIADEKNISYSEAAMEFYKTGEDK